jgi:hypothetical protein
MKNKGLQPSSVIIDTASHSGLYMIKAGNKSKLIMHCHNNPTAMAVPIANRNIHFTRTCFLKQAFLKDCFLHKVDASLYFAKNTDCQEKHSLFLNYN